MKPNFVCTTNSDWLTKSLELQWTVKLWVEVRQHRNVADIAYLCKNKHDMSLSVWMQSIFTLEILTDDNRKPFKNAELSAVSLSVFVGAQRQTDGKLLNMQTKCDLVMMC